MFTQQWLRSYQSAGILDQNTSKVSDDDADQLISPESRMHMTTLDTETTLSGTLTGLQPKVSKDAVIVSKVGYYII